MRMGNNRFYDTVRDEHFIEATEEQVQDGEVICPHEVNCWMCMICRNDHAGTGRVYGGRFRNAP